MRVLHTFADVRTERGGRIGLVPTMGALHEGHMSLIEEAALHSDTVVVSVFVNTMQFNDDSDLAAYPRDLERDVSLAEAAGADIVFAPDDAYMFASDPKTVVSVASVGEHMEGVHRPGHFVGVATVVAKLLAGTQPDVAYFGRKDAQQLAVVTTMAHELSFPTRIDGLPTVREPDGLALSSRNVNLDPRLRDRALLLSGALSDVADAFEAGQRDGAALIRTARARLESDVDLGIDYVAVARATDARPIEPTNSIVSECFLAVAARVGDVRLIDNVFLDPDTHKADRGTRLSTPSILYGGSHAAHH